ncbi:MAG: metabolite traffic protein EboE [Lentisphaeria bacterium]|nr:metabolite traffic protein EboE [Lentisphaeria bacterium]
MTVATPYGALHLTYCLNIHPGESWAENLAAIRDKACAVRTILGGCRPFGLGLRVSARAARELESPSALGAFRAFLDAEGLYVFTINGFPYGTFHGARVKERVYEPDWTHPDRVTYTLRLARILAALLPEGIEGSISTVPGTYRPWFADAMLSPLVDHLVEVVAALAGIAAADGKTVRLALEPEPDCLWDTLETTAAFFGHVVPQQAVPRLADRLRIPRDQAEDTLRRHLGVCLDTCHQAVLFEAPARTLMELQEAHIAVPKVQVSAAPAFRVSTQTLDQAERFVDPCYLHQSCIRTAAGKLLRFHDLPEAIRTARTTPGAEELRTHFHIPLVTPGGLGFASTREELTPAFWHRIIESRVPHVEVETYSYGVLPPELRTEAVEHSIAREIEWTRAALQRAVRARSQRHSPERPETPGDTDAAP